MGQSFCNFTVPQSYIPPNCTHLPLFVVAFCEPGDIYVTEGRSIARTSMVTLVMSLDFIVTSMFAIWIYVAIYYIKK
jgi:hypothetical protein